MDSAVPECRRLARTVRRWQAEILAWNTTGGASNGPTEAANLQIKRINRVGHGFRNWRNYRVLVHCKIDWHNPTTTRIRGRETRPPRLVA
ncbi:MAG: transposase [Chloroflexota bacterium]|nr:transposase [Chloroflexota bacterium]